MIMQKHWLVRISSGALGYTKLPEDSLATFRATGTAHWDITQSCGSLVSIFLTQKKYR